MGNDSENKDIYKSLLERTQKKLAEIESIAIIGTWEFIISTQEVIWSDQMYFIFERPIERGNPLLSDVHDSIFHSDKFQWELLINKVSIDGESVDINIRILDSHGDIKWIRKTARGIFENKHLVAIRGFCQDITEMKRLETHFEMTKNLVVD